MVNTKYIDHYGVLCISPNAVPEVVTAAYKALVLKHHPDKGGDNRKFQLIKEAYGILSDKQKRQSYDAMRKSKDNESDEPMGKYQIIEMIAEGGFGKTYKGRHLILDEFVCIKHCSKVSPIDNQVLIEETKALWDLRHFGIPSMRDLLELNDGSLALVMSYIPGYTLEQIVQKLGCLDAEHVGWIAERIINVLMYLHHNGVVHGDIKPQNIIIQPDSHAVIVVDFGLSLVKPKSGSQSKGYTPHFAAPESVDGNALIPESDFYSLGMTMIYALGGLDGVLKKKVPVNVPDHMCQFIRKLIVKDPLSRPNWEKENLFETIQLVRQKTFGRNRSGMKKIEGL